MKVALYARVSTEKQEEQQTIQSQVELLRTYAKENDYDILGEYFDDGWSGESLDRPELDRLRDDLPKGLLDMVIVTCPDRLSRKQINQGQVLEDFRKNKVKCVFLNMTNIGDSLEDNMFIGMQGLIAEYEKGKILERTRRGRRHKAQSGNVVGGIPPYGYFYVKKSDTGNGYYKINEEEARVVRLISTLFTVEQKGIRGIVKELYKRNIPTRSGRDTWSTSTIARILGNETYTGTTWYNKNYSIELDNPKKKHKKRLKSGKRLRPKNEWIAIKNIPVILSVEAYGAALKQLRRNIELSKRNTKNQYLLRGLIRCGSCNSPVYGTPCHDRTYYRCGSHSQNYTLQEECKEKTHSSKKLEDVVWDSVKQLLNSRELLNQLAREYLAKQDQKPREDYNKALEDVTRLRKEEEKWLNAYKADLIDLEELKNRITPIKKKLKLTANVTAITVEKPDKQDIMIAIKNLVKLARTGLQDLTFEDKQKLLQLFIDRIVLKKKELTMTLNIPLLTEVPNKVDIASITS